MKKEIKKILPLGIVAFLLYLCIFYWPSVTDFVFCAIGAASPLLIGCAIAYLVNILMSFYEHFYFPKSTKKLVTGSRRPVCMILAFLTLIAFIGFVIWMVVPQLTSCVELLLDDLGGGLQAIMAWVDEKNILPTNITDFLTSFDWQSSIGTIIDGIITGIGGVMSFVTSVVFSVFSGLVTALLATIFSIYLLLGRDKLKGQAVRVMKHFIKPTVNETIFHVLGVMNHCFRRYIIGQVTEALILGGLCTLGMLVLGLPYATVIGSLVIFMALIPIAGAYISAILGAILIFTVSPIEALIFLIFIVVLQQVEGNLIYPKVVGNSLGLPGIWVLAAVTVGGGLMGVLGMLLGVPLAATLYKLLREKVNTPPAKKADDAEQTE